MPIRRFGSEFMPTECCEHPEPAAQSATAVTAPRRAADTDADADAATAATAATTTARSCRRGYGEPP